MHALFGAKKLKPDLIILDVGLPGGNGLSVCEMLASDDHSNKIPVIIHTGSTDVHIKDRCEQLGAHYIAKTPGSWDQVKPLVCSLLDIPVEVSNCNVAALQTTVASSDSRSGCAENIASAVPISESQFRAEIDSAFRLLKVRAAKVHLEKSNEWWGRCTSAGHVSFNIALLQKPVAFRAQVIFETLQDLGQDAVRTDQDTQSQNDEDRSVGNLIKPRTTSHYDAASPFAPHENRPKVLTIDDDPDFSKVIKMRLEPLGIEVHRAFSGMQGYWTALDVKPDVIITDMNMPDGEGNYIVGRLKSHPLTQNIPIIVLTGQDNLGLKRMVLGLDVAGYLTKPLNLEQLIDNLREHVDVPHRNVPSRPRAIGVAPKLMGGANVGLLEKRTT